MDRVLIEALKVEVNIGIFEWEQRIRQPVIFDLELAVDTARAAASDCIEDTVDYKAVSGRICELATGRCWGLVETLARQRHSACAKNSVWPGCASLYANPVLSPAPPQ